jgi:hypothetical protein
MNELYFKRYFPIICRSECNHVIQNHFLRHGFLFQTFSLLTIFYVTRPQDYKENRHHILSGPELILYSERVAEKDPVALQT